MGLTLITPPITEPVSLAEVKRQVRVHSSDTTYDTDLQAYLDAAVAHLDGPDGILQVALEPQSYKLTLDAFDGNIILPIGPVISVESVKHYLNDVLTTIDDEDYVLQSIADYRSQIVTIAGWPATDIGPDKIEVEFTAGWEGDLDSAVYIPAVPKSIRQAILLLVGHWWRHRSAVEVVSSGDLVNVPLGFDALLQPFKRIVLA